MPNTTSEQRDLASPGDPTSAKRRRMAAQHVREARDRLTSTSGTRPVFDYELLRQFAQNRLSASLVILLLVGTIGLLSSLWTGPVIAGVWTAGVLIIHLVIVRECRRFLDEARGQRQYPRAGGCASSCSTCFSASPGCSILIHPIGVDEQPARSCCS